MVKSSNIYVGKRKTAIAKTQIKNGSGNVRINGTPIEIHMPLIARERILTALLLAKETSTKYDFDVKVIGGGYMGQAEATTISIARALIGFSKNKKLSNLFSNFDRSLIVGDPRRTEKKKFGGPGPRRRKQKSYR